jgi:hypothetical protein
MARTRGRGKLLSTGEGRNGRVIHKEWACLESADVGCHALVYDA